MNCFALRYSLLIIVLLGSYQPGWTSGQRPKGDINVAQTAFYKGDYQAAIYEYDQVLQRSNVGNNLVKDQVMVLLENRQPQQAIDLMVKEKINGRLLGEAYLALGNKKEAINAFKYELMKPGSHTRSRLLLGWIAAHSKNHHQAINFYWQVLQENPRSSYAHLLMARSFQALAKSSVTERRYFLKRAKEEYQLAKKADRSLWQVNRGLAGMYEDQEDWKDARRQWRKVKSVVGKTKEVKTALKKLDLLIPTPSPSPTPGVIIRSGKIKPAKLKLIKVKPLGQKDDPVIKVGLGKSLSSLSFGCVGPWRAFDHKGRHFWKGAGQRGYRIKRHVDGLWYLTSWEGKRFKRIRKKLTIKPLNPETPLVVLNHYHNDGYFWSGGVKSSSYYRGQFKIKLNKKKLKLINHVLLEDYLLSVVPSEMPALWPKEALKTQAVVARTDSLMRRGTHRKVGYDVCTTAHCAVYRGVTVEHKRSNAAVADTQGEVLTRQNKLIPTFYSHACGGLTQSFQEAWRKKITDYAQRHGIVDMNHASSTAMKSPLSPFELNQLLITEPDVFCKNKNYSGRHSFRWTKIIGREELSQLAQRKYNIGELQAIRVKQRGPSGYVRHIELAGTNKNKQVYRDYIRSALGGVRSNLFQIQPIKINPKHQVPDAWIITGGGWGHGVGLCQAGTGAMGALDYKYEAILEHYFPNSELQVWTK